MTNIFFFFFLLRSVTYAHDPDELYKKLDMECPEAAYSECGRRAGWVQTAGSAVFASVTPRRADPRYRFLIPPRMM